MTRPHVAVIGGGATGLAAAYELRNDAHVTIFEAGSRLGGKIRTEELGGIPIELGPDSLLARDEAPINLLRDLGLENEIVEPSDFGAWIAARGEPKRLPEGFILGIPASPTAIVRSGLLSPLGIARAALDLIRPRTSVGDDVSLGHLIRPRFGNEVADRIVTPLMSGIRAGDIDEMSAAMAAPEIAAAARDHRSLTLGLRKVARRATRPRFIGLRRGMASLVDALREASGADVQLDTRVSTITSAESIFVDGVAFDGAVITAPPPAAATMLGQPLLNDVEFAAVGVVNLLYRPGTIAPLPSGSGILFGPNHDHGLIASTWYTQKWPHLAPADGSTVIRCVTRPGKADARVADAVARVTDAGDPVGVTTHVWDHAQPIFRVGHRRRIEAVLETLSPHPIRVAGAGYLATGLNDCLAHGRHTARELLRTLGP